MPTRFFPFRPLAEDFFLKLRKISVLKKILSVIGARPQFIKHAALQIELQKYYDAVTVHTGQHYDQNMSHIFFETLRIPPPDHLLSIPPGLPHGAQTGTMMTQIEDICFREKPAAVLVYGDTNSTLAGALVAAKLNIPLIHIEAGLRSFNRSMPEEINRIVADEFANLLFCPTEAAVHNLRTEGITHDGIFLCGDVMIDTLHLVKDKMKRPNSETYYFTTLHRPYNTDDRKRLLRILDALNTLGHKVIFPTHPRVVAKMAAFRIQQGEYRNIDFIDPVDYVDSLSYQYFSHAVITDSGGMQKEAYTLGKKCVTIRSETEWKETLHDGWNTLAFENLHELNGLLSQPTANHNPHLYGDGQAAKSIVQIIRERL